MQAYRTFDQLLTWLDPFNIAAIQKVVQKKGLLLEKPSVNCYANQLNLFLPTSENNGTVLIHISAISQQYPISG